RQHTEVIKATRCKWVNETRTCKVPYVTCKMVPEQRVCCVPHTTCTMEPYCVTTKVCRQVPVCVPVCETTCCTPKMSTCEWFARLFNRGCCKCRERKKKRRPARGRSRRASSFSGKGEPSFLRPTDFPPPERIPPVGSAFSSTSHASPIIIATIPRA